VTVLSLYTETSIGLTEVCEHFSKGLLHLFIFHAPSMKIQPMDFGYTYCQSQTCTFNFRFIWLVLEFWRGVSFFCISLYPIWFYFKVMYLPGSTWCYFCQIEVRSNWVDCMQEIWSV